MVVLFGQVAKMAEDTVLLHTAMRASMVQDVLTYFNGNFTTINDYRQVIA